MGRGELETAGGERHNRRRQKNVKKKQGGDEVQMCGRGVKYVSDCKG